jgi:hypothetical protein
LSHRLAAGLSDSTDDAEQIVHRVTERPDFRDDLLNGHVRPIELGGCLLAGREQKDQRSNYVVIGGDVDSFLGSRASARSETDRSLALEPVAYGRPAGGR